MLKYTDHCVTHWAIKIVVISAIVPDKKNNNNRSGNLNPANIQRGKGYFDHPEVFPWHECGDFKVPVVYPGFNTINSRQIAFFMFPLGARATRLSDDWHNPSTANIPRIPSVLHMATKGMIFQTCFLVERPEIFSKRGQKSALAHHSTRNGRTIQVTGKEGIVFKEIVKSAL